MTDQAANTTASGKPQALTEKERAFWHAIWALQGAGLFVVVATTQFAQKAMGDSWLGVGTALVAFVLAHAATRYGLWMLTRAYATTSAYSVPAVDRARLCNFDLTQILICAILLAPKGLAFPADLLAIAAPMLLGGLIWVMLHEPLKAANARDAARNVEQAV